MTDKVYVVTDLGVGDGGKGGVVHAVATKLRAHTVIKRGGAQGSHGVHTSRGEKFAFSQWGCGTFEGIPTHLSEQMVVSPEGLLNEASTLRYGHGLTNVFDLLTVDEAALCTTPFHGISSRLKELARGSNPRGTVGTGVGEAYRNFGKYPELAIKAGDLQGPRLREQLAAIRERVRKELQPLLDGEFLAGDQVAAAEEIALLGDDGFLNHVVARFEEAGRLANIVGSDYLGNEILSRKGIAVVETSHGVLSDRLVGFHPHTSAIRTLPRFTRDMLERAGYDGQIVNLGVTRAYAIRHGAGPMPTIDSRMTENLLPNSNKDENRYQGAVRVGPLDFVMLRYALAACGGPSVFDGLAMTWFDQIQTNKVWKWCDRYVDADDSDYFSPSGEIRLNQGGDLAHQELLGEKLLSCRPEISTMPIDLAASPAELYATCEQVVQDALGVAVRMMSFGPTELDKFYR
ncbi:MAG TPA: adenylosuccinate synthetase [Candidatus Microsaccharimonas sp.]|jgi:adenylosuccinate synthase